MSRMEWIRNHPARHANFNGHCVQRGFPPNLQIPNANAIPRRITRKNKPRFCDALRGLRTSAHIADNVSFTRKRKPFQPVPQVTPLRTLKSPRIFGAAGRDSKAPVAARIGLDREGRGA